ncbi:hypothetical protein PAMA_007814 [Pampus argenteus]
MELELEVVLSSSIKRKKPWPRFCWLGQEKESVFLLDDKRISEINMVSGRTKKRTPKLHPFLNSVVTMASSHNAMWLCGLLVSGELFLWNRDKDLLKTAAAVPEVVHVIATIQGNATRLSLQVSGDGMRVLLVAITGQVFLWECMDVRDLTGVRDGTVKGYWAHIQPLEDTILPSSQDNEASQHTIFVKTEAVGDACLSAFVFTSGKKLILTCLKIQWEGGHMRVGSVGYSIQWATKTYPMSRLTPACQPVKSRGALVPAFSPDGRLLAIVLNQRQPKATQVLFVSTQNFVSVSSGLGGCGSKKMEIPSKYIRPPMSAGKGEASLSSSSMSVRDVLRQRYSVTWHPRLLYFIVSDGYMATVLRVLDRPSPTLLLKTLLMDTSKGLEKASRILAKSQIHVKAWLESVSCLNLDSSPEEFKPIVTCLPNTTDSVISAATDRTNLPLFLQDQGTLGGTKELLEKVQTFFEDDSDIDGPPAGSHVEDGGRLEFASMFDTLHALDTHMDTALIPTPDHEKDYPETEKKTPLLHQELGKIQSKLLTAWAFSMSLGNTVENKAYLLKHTLYCVVRFAALLHLIPCSTVSTEKKNTSVSTCLLNLLKALLSFLPWDSIQSDGPRCLRLVVELSKQLVRLLLSPHPESYQTGHCQLSSHSLSTALHILQLVSDSLDQAYSLQQRTVWSSAETHRWPSDVHCVPLLQDEKKEKSSFVYQARPLPQRPSSRMFGVWRWVYEITQQYMEELKGFEGCDGWEEEQQQLSLIISQIQTALQATGERLEECPTLLSYPGEHLFLCGMYTKSADTWWSHIWEESKKSCDRSVFQETRLCLALLYSQLSQYHLREAQELGDHMARLILHRAAHQQDSTTCITDSLPCPSLPIDLHNDTVCAVIQTLGRFMAAYFTNQPLYILPAHNVGVLPPLHLPHAPSVGRMVPLCQEEVARAVRRQQLSEVWTVDYAQDLLLLGGLLPETVWLAYHLGDWKTAASLSLAYTSYCSGHFDFTRFRRRELHLPTVLEPESIFQAELKCLFGSKADSQESRDEDSVKSFTDPLEEEDWDLLQVSIQEILKASVMAGVNVMSSPMSSLLDTAKNLCSCLPALVPNGLYLPSPPLYCPQPSPNTQDPIGTIGQFAEVASRHKVSGLLQRLLLLLRAAHCCHPAAQWYISHLRRSKHLLHKIKKKYSYPSAAEEEKTFPEGLMKFVTRSGFFRPEPNKDGHLDPDIIQTIICFRELCGLCWMLHVRDQLSISCRKYQAARQHGRDKQIPGDSEVNSACVDALHWARRYLPFSHFLNAEEVLQDILLSLVSELPPVSVVADMLVHAFPKEEESVRVPLREKYNSLLQRLRQCSVLEGEKDEPSELMIILLQDKLRQRRKHLGRLQRHLAAPELHLWEKEEEVEDRGSKHGMAMLRQLSLGTSLSASTLTDCGFPLLCSDGDTAENTSDAVSPEQHSRSINRGKKAKVRDRETSKKTVKTERVIQEESQPADPKENDDQHNVDLPSLPVVGTWEFELEDEEYLNFLELFLSYVLEKDSTDGGDSDNELPLLRSFSSKLKERELHSLTFDVLTTIHRHQRDGHHPARKHLRNNPPVFRAGCCYKPMKQGTTPELQNSSICSEAPISRTSLSVTSLPGLRTGRQNGLFGLQQQSRVPLAQRTKGFDISPNQSAFPTGQPSDCLVFGSSTSVQTVIELQQGLDPKLEAQFPELGRLLEWMVRWADRKVLLGHHCKKKKAKGSGVGGTADDGVVIRVKASAPAVLTSLSLLEHRYSALLGTDHYSAHIQVPETQRTVAPVLQPEVDKKLERESSIDTGYPGSANTPITGLGHNLQQGELSIGSHTDEPEELAFHRTPLPNDQDQLTFDTQMRPSSSLQPSLGDLDVTPEKEEPQALPTVQPEAAVHAHLSNSTGVEPPTTLVDPPGLQPQSSTPGAPTVVPTAHNQPSSAPPMRQRLGEDLFRLVQHINYMSLMEVLGASFSNLQLAQQNSSLAQSNMNSSNPNVPSSYTNTNFMHQPNALPVQTTISGGPQTQKCVPSSESCNSHLSQVPACMFADQPAMQGLGKPPPTGDQCHSTRNGAGVNYQEMQPLSVQAEVPEIKFRQSRRLIPSSQGLLTTTDTSHTISAPVVASNGSIQSDPASQVLGLKLLQLHHSTLSQQSAPHYPQGQDPQMLLTANPSNKESHPPHLKHSNQAALKKTDEDKRSGSLVLKRQLGVNNSPPHDPTPRSLHLQNQTSERSREKEFSLLPPADGPALVQGVRLLHFQPVPQRNITFPKIPIPSSRPFTVISAPIGETPRIKLLHIDSPPKMMLPLAAPSAQMTRLTSMEELTSSVIGKQNAEEGSFDSSLSGQKLLDKAMSTAAELHVFASTCKRPPECQDAFTNTDPACPPTLVDKAVSAQDSVTASSPNFHDTVETSQAPEKKNLDMHGRQFLSVLDLEDKTRHQDLPSSLIQGTQGLPSIDSLPTSAQLHVLATSVIRSAALDADPQPSPTVPVDIQKPSTHPDILEESPSLSYIEPNWDPERVAPQDSVDLSDSEICQAIKIPSARYDDSSYKPPTVWFSSRLSELDAQLAALQNIADYLEMDFTNSRMLVNTIEKLTPILAPDVKTAVKKTVRLSVPQEAWTPRLVTVTEPNTYEEKENLEEQNVVDNDSCTAEGKLSFHYSTSSYSHSAGPCYPNMKHHLSEAAGISHVLADENLGQTGLSDTAEILDELVKEGYLSLTDMDLSTSQTAHNSSSLEQQQSSWVTQKRVPGEDERRELRTWMRRKQRERLAVYHKHRESLKERERKPFSASRTMVACMYVFVIEICIWIVRAMLLEQYNQRTREACSLARDFLTSPPTLPGSSQPQDALVAFTTRSTSAPPSDGTHSVSANNKRSLKSGQAQPHLRPWTAEVQERPSEDHRRRLGLHRPVTSLPRDRLSQVTRRGMLTDTKSHSKVHTASQGEEQPRRMGLNKSPSGRTSVGRGIHGEQTRLQETEERDVANLHKPFSEMFRQLGPEESNSNRVLAALLDEQDDGATAGLSDMDWLDNISESASSSLSRIDWAAIERMVAAEDA